MKACDIDQHSVFSIDGGETWLIAKADPKDSNDEKITVWVSPREDVSLSSSFHIELGYYDHVWEPEPQALNRGDNYLPVRN